MNKGIRSLLIGGGIGCVLILFSIWVSGIQHDVGEKSGKPTEAAEYVAPSPTEDLSIVFVDDIPMAVSLSPTQTPPPTATPTYTPTPTVAPTATEKPRRATSTPKPTNTPTPTKKPQNTAKYEKGTAGTKYAEVNGKHGYKPWARHTAVTNKKSPQYRLEQIAKTDELGRRIVKDPNGEWRYLIALPVYWAGGTYADIGRCVDIQMANGAVLKCVLADIKKIEHSQGKQGKYGSHGEIIEVICDKEKLIPAVKNSGDASKFGTEWQGDVKSVTAYDMFIDF